MMQGDFFERRDTLAEARETIIQNRDKGISCPCCGTFCKVYPRQIHSTMACDIIAAYKLDKSKPGEFWHDTVIMRTSHSGGNRSSFGDFSKLQLWGLCELASNERYPQTRTSGFWRITPAGIDFVMKKIKVPYKIYVYQNRILGQSEDLVDITRCLGKHFNYGELMGDF